MKFRLPEVMPTDQAALAELRDEAVAEFNDLYNPDRTPSEEEFADMKRLNDAINAISKALEEVVAAAKAEAPAEQKDADAEASARAAEAAKMAEQFAATKEEVEAAPREDETKSGEGEDSHLDKSKSPAETVKPAKTDFSRAATGRTPDVTEVKDEAGFRLTTSAKNYETGMVDTFRVAEEFNSMAKGGSTRVLGANGRSETTFAYFDRGLPEEFSIQDSNQAVSVLDRVTDESRLEGGSLVAAGGWVAPSERIYSFLPVQAATGLLSLPQVSIRRGGIMFPQEPDFGAIYSQIGFHQTEAQAQAGEEKPCFEVPDVQFDEVRLDVQGICITAGILQDHAWPELTQKFVDEAMRLHLHKISAWQIGKIVAGSTNVGTLTDPMFGTAGAVLSALELQVADMRARHRLGRGESLEGIAPEWLLSIIRADLAYRDEVLPEQVTDDMIRRHFANIGANFQFVADWQVGGTNQLGSTTAATAWPETVDVILYPAGTWWGAVEPVVNLGIIRDSALIRQNKQIQMFTEDGVAVGKRGPESRQVTIPVAVNGTVGPRYAAASA